MAGLQIPISGEPASVVLASTDILVAVVGASTKKITAGNARAQMFAFAATDPLNCGNITAVGASTITGALSGITVLGAAQISGTTMTGDLLFTDATYDIGKPGATRPRDGSFSRALVSAFMSIGTNPGGSGILNLSYQAGLVWRNATNTGDVSGLRQGTNTLMVIDIGLSVGLSLAVGTTLTVGTGLTVTSGGITVSAGGINVTSATVTSGGSAATGGLNIQRAGTPTTPNDGDKWVTTVGEFTRVNGTTKTVLFVNTQPGYTNPWTGTLNRATAYDASTVTLVQLAQRVAAIQADLTTLLAIGP